MLVGVSLCVLFSGFGAANISADCHAANFLVLVVFWCSRKFSFAFIFVCLSPWVCTWLLYGSCIGLYGISLAENFGILFARLAIG
jgi:hypothetical protein